MVEDEKPSPFPASVDVTFDRTTKMTRLTIDMPPDSEMSLTVSGSNQRFFLIANDHCVGVFGPTNMRDRVMWSIDRVPA